MIDKGRFITGMAALGGAFGREIEAAVQRMYFAVLGPKMTTDEFERAISIVMAREKFWPSPAVLLGAIGADDSTRAVNALDHVNRVAGRNGGYRFLTSATFHAEFDAPTKAAISAVGGLAAIANTTEERLSSLQRRFVEAYQSALRSRLPVLQTNDRVKQLAVAAGAE